MSAEVPRAAVVGSGLVGSALQRLGVPAISGDTRALTATDLADVDVLFHTAFKSVDHDQTGFSANVAGTRALVEAAVGAGVRRVIMTSTVGVYGHASHLDADETTPVAPDTPFSKSRAEAEAILQQAPIESITVRTRFVYGQGDRAVVPRIHGVARKSPVWVDGGRALLSVVWVDDLARLMGRMAHAELPPEGIVHVTDGEPVSFRQFATELCDVLGGTPPRASVPLPLLAAPVRAYERLRGIDPETSPHSISSIRLALAASDQTFSSRRLTA